MITKRPILIAVAGIGLCAIIHLLIHGGWDAVVRTYHKTTFHQDRATTKRLRSLGLALEQRHMRPPITDYQIANMCDWSEGPVQYESEDGRAVLRAAGRDMIFHTGDDITVQVDIRQETK
jgi:hypothetical protein